MKSVVPYHQRVSLRRRLVVAVAIVLAIVIAGAMAVRRPLLRAAGWALVAQDPLVSVDVIVIAIGAGGSGVLEAADLVHAGIARRVAIMDDSPDSIDEEFARRGIESTRQVDVAIRQLKQLGVEAVERVPTGVVGTESEGEVLPVWCAANHIRSLVLITTPDHSRRVRRVIRRSMPAGLIVIVRSTRHSTFDPDRWWVSRVGVRTGIVEAQKLLLDMIRHPLG
jgi:hypothetical protein